MSADDSAEPLAHRWSAVMMDTYGTPPLALVRGAGSTVWDESGRAYTDFTGGIAVNTLGHAHPAVVAAVTAQVSRLGHVSNLFASEPAVALAERLLALLGRAGRVFFVNSVRRRSKRPSKSPVGPVAPTWSPPKGVSTDAPWALWR